MTARRAPSAPPAIPGHTFVRSLGGGGFADVFLYEQQWPRRRVAVKVLLADLLGAEARKSFEAEADLMAQVSGHPSIVTIYGAGVAADGRPFLVMEFCPPPSLNQRYRKEPFSVADALRIGIEVAGAVETAHRSGILHRDIKPANILVTEYDTPALTDFGISATIEGASGSAEGMSIPWSPSETFADPPASGVGTDVWALAATVYSLLAGRSPFEIPGGANGGHDLIDRIQREPLPGIGRPDVPASLERVLATAMAKAPASRYSSALALARELQQVQVELGLSATRAAVLDSAGLENAGPENASSVIPLGTGPASATRPGDEPGQDDDGDPPGTRIRPVRSIDPAPAPARRNFVAPPPGEPAPGAHTLGPPNLGPSPSDTVLRATLAASGVLASSHPPAFRWEEGSSARPGSGPTPARAPQAAGAASAAPPATEGHATAPPLPRRRALWLWSVGLVLLAGAAATGLTLFGGGGPSTANPTAGPDVAEPMDVVGDSVVPMPAGLAGAVVGGEVIFTWENPGPRAGDVFLYRVVDDFGEGRWREATEATATVPADEDERTCFQVRIVRDNGTSGDVAGGCAP